MRDAMQERLAGEWWVLLEHQSKFPQGVGPHMGNILLGPAAVILLSTRKAAELFHGRVPPAGRENFALAEVSLGEKAEFLENCRDDHGYRAVAFNCGVSADGRIEYDPIDVVPIAKAISFCRANISVS